MKEPTDVKNSDVSNSVHSESPLPSEKSCGFLHDIFRELCVIHFPIFKKANHFPSTLLNKFLEVLTNCSVPNKRLKKQIGEYVHAFKKLLLNN